MTASVHKKRLRYNLKQEKQPEIVVLKAQGLTQREIAAQLGCSTATVNRSLKGQDEQVATIQQNLANQLMTAIEKHISLESRAGKYADLALNAKNEAVSLASLTRIDDLQGIVTDRERMRIDKQTQAPQIQPMFMMPAGTEISVTVKAPGPQDVVKQARDVTPEYRKVE